MRGSNWTSWFPNRWLREHGYIKDTFVDAWSALLPPSGLNEGKDARPFSYLGILKGQSHPPPGWKDPNFADGKWTKAKGPMSREKGSELAPVSRAELHYFRIAFNSKKTNYAAWKLYIQNSGHRPAAVVYLNGHCIAWIDKHRATYEPVDLPVSALKYLKKGENVLAIRARRSDKGFDIGIYAKEEE